ncbi:hypothetical protein PtA15_4A538 [Puccinia triticina]|uniref:Uncharacterized protein n=1 Tax=Puccinia triticina TaxID=208348 RepID=A0ABY7CMS1_9BASI|nr:uncharacterized protein PtA15_4A538 [Puccinia triticina]WAQ84087.1 hypothetical protein PtA15_4A538 [Puccinia triticina]WAR54920.1 hypothetical protein PtB15_4B538 [Puccinia triticina]
MPFLCDLVESRLMRTTGMDTDADDDNFSDTSDMSNDFLEPDHVTLFQVMISGLELCNAVLEELDLTVNSLFAD